MNHKSLLLSLFLMVGFAVLAQNTSVFTQTYAWSKADTEKNSTIDNNRSNRNSISQSIGVLLPTKRMVYYGEFALYFHESKRTALTKGNNKEMVYNYPSTMSHSIKLGLGKSVQINKDLQYHLLSYLGYERTYKTVNTISSIQYIEDATQLNSFSEYERPKIDSYALGIKIMLDYKLLKRLSLGITFNGDINYSVVDSHLTNKNTVYDKHGQINKQVIYSFQEKNQWFYNRFFQTGIYLNYTISKK